MDGFNKGKIPSIKSAWENLLEKECKNQKNKALDLFR